MKKNKYNNIEEKINKCTITKYSDQYIGLHFPHSFVKNVHRPCFPIREFSIFMPSRMIFPPYFETLDLICECGGVFKKRRPKMK